MRVRVSSGRVVSGVRVTYRARARVATVQEEAAVYLLVNGGGTPQTDADMSNAARIANGEG